MKKTGIYVVAFLLFLSFTLFSTALLSMSVTIPSFGVISNPPVGYSIYKNGVTTYLQDSSGQDIYFNTNVNLVFSKAFEYLEYGGDLTVKSGTYIPTAGSSITMQNCQNVYVFFESGSLLYAPDHFDIPIFYVNNVHNSVIFGISIDGNKPNQYPYWGAVGVDVYRSSGVVVANATINNCGTYGYYDHYDAAGEPNGIVNSTLLFNGQNGISLGSSYEPLTIGAYAINNEVAYDGDVGISVIGQQCKVIDNYIHDMNGTEHLSSRWGLAVEYAETKYNQFINNTVVNCPVGVETGDLDSTGYNYYAYNTLINCATGFGGGGGAGNNIITYNTIINNQQTVQGQPVYYAIRLGNSAYGYGQPNDVISYNTIISSDMTFPFVYVTAAIEVQKAVNATIASNIITAPQGEISWLITIDNSEGTLIINNALTGNQGIQISTSAINTRLNNNLYDCLSTELQDQGINTAIDPVSPATYTLAICNPYDGSSQGTTIYPAGTQILLNASSSLNVDGLNVTSPYTLTMNENHFVYALSPLAFSVLS